MREANPASGLPHGVAQTLKAVTRGVRVARLTLGGLKPQQGLAHEGAEVSQFRGYVSRLRRQADATDDARHISLTLGMRRISRQR